MVAVEEFPGEPAKPETINEDARVASQKASAASQPLVPRGTSPMGAEFSGLGAREAP